MNTTNSKHEKISFRVTTGEKNQLKRQADLAGKPLAEYIRDTVFSTTLSVAEKKVVENIKQINEKILQQEADLNNLKKSIYVTTRLSYQAATQQIIIRKLLSEISEEETRDNTQDKAVQDKKAKEQAALERKAQEIILAYYNKCMNEAEKKFNIGSENV